MMVEQKIRILDIILALVGVLIVLPIFVPIAILLKLTGEGKIIYMQERVGHRGNRFGLIKFATMYENSPSIGTGDITIKNDPRVLPVGKVLRKTKVNELPQLFNILKGDMTFVGFRPHTPNALQNYSEAQVQLVTQLKPGLTGYGSLEFSDEENLLPDDPIEAMAYYKNIIVPRKVELEQIWIDNRNISNYFKIVFATAIKVLRPKFGTR